MSTRPSSRASRCPSLAPLYRFLAQWARPRVPVAQPRIRPYLEILETRLTPTGGGSNFYLVTTTADNTMAISGGTGTSADPFLAPSLRSAILAAEADGGTDTINFDPSIAKGVIDLTVNPLNPATGTFPGPTAFDIANPLTIIGSGQTITRNANPNDDAPAFRFFFVEAKGSLSLSNLTLSNGLAQGGDGAAGGGGAAGLGGAIYNQGALSVQGVTFTADAAVGGAGGDGSANSGYGGGGGLGGPGNTGGGGGSPNGGGFNGAGGFGGGGGGGSNGHAGADGGFGGGGPGGQSYGGGAGGFGGGRRRRGRLWRRLSSRRLRRRRRRRWQ